MRDFERALYGRPLHWYERIEPLGWVFIGLVLSVLGLTVWAIVG
jgi:hypothetical protein